MRTIFSIEMFDCVSTVLLMLSVQNSNTSADIQTKSPSLRGQRARHLSNCHIHFLPPVSGAGTSNNAVRTHKTQTAKGEGRAPFVLFLEWVLLILKRETETGQQFTYQMNENKNAGWLAVGRGGSRVGSGLFWSWTCSKTTSRMFKVRLNEERRVRRGWVDVGKMRPAPSVSGFIYV